MKPHFFLMFLAVLAFGCSDVETTEVTDTAGNVIERYGRKKADFAKQGLYERFDSTGVLMEMAHYQNDTLHGERKLFYENGKLQYAEQYAHGAFAGPYIAYYGNGEIELTGQYKDGAMQGKWRRYYDNGQLMEEVHFEDNNENGPFVEYHKNGNLKAEGAYLEGDFEHGLLKMYDEKGELERKMDCNRGICRTTWKREES